jgi:hypothetical protein
MAPTPDGWLTRQEAAARLGIGLRTLDWQRARGDHGQLVHFIRVGGRRRLLYSERELERYVGLRELRDVVARARLIAAIRSSTKARRADLILDVNTLKSDEDLIPVALVEAA